jgi:MOSC domain-containing protein YiiM
VRGVNLDGDEQVDLRVHGGDDKAVYAYSVEDYEWWSAKLGRELGAGTFGENLTVSGIDPSNAVIGAHWRVGTAVLQVTQPRLPCFKIGMRMGDAEFVDQFEAAARFGAYLRITHEGDVGAGDVVEVEKRARAGITVRELGMANRDSEVAFVERVLADASVPDGWHQWARRQLARR